MNIASYVTSLASEEPDRTALIYPNGTLTYGELEDLSNRTANGLLNFGLKKGSRTVLMVKPGPEFLVICFALIKMGAIPVLVDPGMGWKKLRKCLAIARPVAFVGTPLAHLARILFGWARSTVKLLVTVGSFRLWPGSTYSSLAAQDSLAPISGSSGEEGIGAIVFTTGSTGIPKGVIYTHQMFTAQIELMRDEFGIKSGEIDLATFPLFALFDPALRVTTVFPKMDFTRPGSVDPRKIVRPILEHKCTHMFGSPALLDQVGRFSEEYPVKLPSLKRVLTAGAPVSTRTLRRFSKLLEGEAEIHTPYGATEALPICSISSCELLLEDGSQKGKGICVGRPIGSVKLEIIQITDDPIEHFSADLVVPRGVIGEIVVWGPNVSTSYFELPLADKQSKILNSEGVIGHRMGDLGYLDESGRVWFCGRKSHRVVTPFGTLFTVPCEGVFNQHPAVHRSALVGIGDAPNQRAVLCVELEPGFKGNSILKKEILDLGASLPQKEPIENLLFHPSFPVDVRHNAKIFREKLAQWAAGRVR